MTLELHIMQGYKEIIEIYNEEYINGIMHSSDKTLIISRNDGKEVKFENVNSFYILF